MHFRTGGKWGVTFVREGVELEDEHGHRSDDQLWGMALKPEYAQEIVDALNERSPDGPAE